MNSERSKNIELESDLTEHISLISLSPLLLPDCYVVSKRGNRTNGEPVIALCLSCVIFCLLQVACDFCELCKLLLAIEKVSIMFHVTMNGPLLSITCEFTEGLGDNHLLVVV